jgi:hypothetical protein
MIVPLNNLCTQRGASSEAMKANTKNITITVCSLCVD